AGQMLAVRACDPSFQSLCGQLLDASGHAAGRELRITHSHGRSYVSALALALPSGDFLVTWLASDGVRARRIPWMIPGDAPCLQRRGELVCDLRHDGGAAEVRYAFATQPGDLPLLGDPDGDGRDDPCAYRDGRFLCDTAHDGGAPELGIDFGTAGDTPLLGDLDGDGRDDPCVFRDGWFRCDTAHNGGAAEPDHLLGGTAVVRGVFRDGWFRCDTAHNGGAAEQVIRFGASGDPALLADL